MRQLEVENKLRDVVSRIIVQVVPARFLRLPEVIARVGLRRSAIYQRMSEGRFPRSRSLGPKCVVWVEAEIDDWMREIVSS